MFHKTVVFSNTPNTRTRVLKTSKVPIHSLGSPVEPETNAWRNPVPVRQNPASRGTNSFGQATQARTRRTRQGNRRGSCCSNSEKNPHFLLCICWRIHSSPAFFVTVSIFAVFRRKFGIAFRPSRMSWRPSFWHVVICAFVHVCFCEPICCYICI